MLERFSSLIIRNKDKDQKYYTKVKCFTTQMLSRLPTCLVQLQAGNNSERRSNYCIFSTDKKTYKTAL